MARWFIDHFPIIGMLLFAGLYAVSSFFYPGGSHIDKNSAGFDWVNNYWCDLLDRHALNGSENTAQLYAISAMAILCMSLLVFFFQFSVSVLMTGFWKTAIRTSGTLSMLTAVFISTEHHDLVTMLSSIFGLFALIGILTGVIMNRLKKYLWSGILCIALIIVNNYIYYSKSFLIVLPLIQKVTFAAVLLWVTCMSISLKKLRKM